MINKNWERWIFASVSKHFDTYRESVPLYIEGQERQTQLLDEFIELRVDGPYFKEVSKGCTKIDIEINLLCCVKKNNDNFRIHKLTGVVAAAFKPEIFVYKFGDDPLELWECLRLRSDKREAVIVSHFGQPDPDLPLMQATVEGHYTVLHFE